VRETRILTSNGHSISVTLSKSDDVLGSMEMLPKGVVRIPQFHQTIAITKHGVNSAKGLFARCQVVSVVANCLFCFVTYEINKTASSFTTSYMYKPSL